jgi:tetratricopeptide (TPR) repeat protein
MEDNKMNQDNGKLIRENRSVEHCDSDVWRDRAAAFCYLGALQAYDKALELNPDDYNAWSGKGMTLDALDRYEEALQAYDKALELNPDDYNAWCGKAMTLFNLRYYEEALQVFDNAIRKALLFAN